MTLFDVLLDGLLIIHKNEVIVVRGISSNELNSKLTGVKSTSIKIDIEILDSDFWYISFNGLMQVFHKELLTHFKNYPDLYVYLFEIDNPENSVTLTYKFNRDILSKIEGAMEILKMKADFEFNVSRETH